MAEKWERTYEELCSEAGESTSSSLSWARLFKILRRKFEPIVDLSDGKLAELRARMDNRLTRRKMLYLFDTSICSFCKRATVESGSADYGLNSRACRACILEGKCFDESWLVKPIYKAIKSGDYALFRALVRRGLRDIAYIIENAGEEERREPL